MQLQGLLKFQFQQSLFSMAYTCRIRVRKWQNGCRFCWKDKKVNNFEAVSNMIHQNIKC